MITAYEFISLKTYQLFFLSDGVHFIKYGSTIIFGDNAYYSDTIIVQFSS